MSGTTSVCNGNNSILPLLYFDLVKFIYYICWKTSGLNIIMRTMNNAVAQPYYFVMCIIPLLS
jgi:hypothetical protein